MSVVQLPDGRATVLATQDAFCGVCAPARLKKSGRKARLYRFFGQSTRFYRISAVGYALLRRPAPPLVLLHVSYPRSPRLTRPSSFGRLIVSSRFSYPSVGGFFFTPMFTPPVSVHYEYSIQRVKFSIEGSEFSIEGSKFSIEGSKFSIEGSEFSTEGSEFSIEGSEFRNRNVQLNNRSVQLNNRSIQLNNRSVQLNNRSVQLNNWSDGYKF